MTVLFDINQSKITGKTQNKYFFPTMSDCSTPGFTRDGTVPTLSFACQDWPAAWSGEMWAPLQLTGINGVL